MNRKIVSMSNITKTYYMGQESQTVLKGINLDIYEGEFLSVLGPSGSGKSTLMNIIGCLDTPTSGEYTLSGKNICDMSETSLAKIRSCEVGFVFQSFHLLSRMTALDNVELPLIYARVPHNKSVEIAKTMLKRVGLEDKMNYYPNQLSGGQQQRVAIARALATNPTILLADEPTGALDQNTGKQVMALFKEINKEGRTVIMITHDKTIADYANRVIRILDGNLFEGDEQGNKTSLYSNDSDIKTQEQSNRDDILDLEVSEEISPLQSNINDDFGPNGPEINKQIDERRTLENDKGKLLDVLAKYHF